MSISRKVCWFEIDLDPLQDLVFIRSDLVLVLCRKSYGPIFSRGSDIKTNYFLHSIVAKNILLIDVILQPYC